MMRLASAAALGFLTFPTFAEAQGEPLSAIDWLSQSVASTSTGPIRPSLLEPPVSLDARTPNITVTPLGTSEPGVVGVLPPDVTGLPRDLWARSDLGTLAALIRAEPAETMPALEELLVTLMLAEAEPPLDATGRDLLILRVDKLLDMGALEAARSLLESGDLLDPELFRRWFDVTLLTGTEHDACAILRGKPALAPTLPARVFCLARNGDWNAAVLTLNTARALGDVTPEEEALLARFLDPELAEPADGLVPASRPSPLFYRLREAVGDLIPTTGLPLAFSHADLRDTVAWRAQIEAAERLARNGALSENVLLGAYTARAPAASGGVWDRAAAVQRLDRAIEAGDAAEVAVALPSTWDAIQEVELEVPFARLYGEALLSLKLEGEAGALAHRVALLSPAYEAAAQTREPASPREAVWQAIATGQIDGVQPTDASSAAVLAGFADVDLPTEIQSDLDAGRLGEGILRAVEAFQQGLDGDHEAVTQAIATLRRLGLEDGARRAALQFLLLSART